MTLGLFFGDEGVIVCTGAEEELEGIDGEGGHVADVIPSAADKLGCGHCTKTGSKCYGAEWEQH